MVALPLYGPPKVGGDCLAYCTRCKIELAHVIIAMVEKRPAKVICKTCKSQHNYKLGVKGSKKAPGRGGAKAKADSVTVRASEYWQQCVDKCKTDPKPFSVKEVFSKGDLIDHTQFGLGVVDEVRINNKILVTFRVGEKLLVHSLGKSA